MVVGICTVELRIEGSRSLKDRRRVVQSLKTRLRSCFNISISEVHPDGTWTGATLGIAAVAPGRNEAEQLLRKVLDKIEYLQPGVVQDAIIEYV